MAVEYIKRHLFHAEKPPASLPLYREANTLRSIHLSPDVERLLSQASDARAEGDDQEYRDLSIQAASRADAVYRTIPPEGLTAEGRLYRATHAMTAFTQYLDLDESASAREIGGTILSDQLIPEASREKVRRDLELLRAEEERAQAAKTIWENLEKDPEFERRMERGTEQLDAGERILFEDNI